MKKSMIFWMFAAVLTITGLTSCSDDDDFYEKDYNYKSAIVGTWYLVYHSSGWGGITDYNVGEIIVTFTNKGEVKVVNNGISPVSTSTYTYSFHKIPKSIFTGISATVITFNDSSSYYYINFSNGVLYISEEAYDGSHYALKRMPN